MAAESRVYWDCTVPPSAAGQRLDVFLQRLAQGEGEQAPAWLAQRSRSELQRWLAAEGNRGCEDRREQPPRLLP